MRLKVSSSGSTDGSPSMLWDTSQRSRIHSWRMMNGKLKMLCTAKKEVEVEWKLDRNSKRGALNPPPYIRVSFRGLRGSWCDVFNHTSITQL